MWTFDGCRQGLFGVSAISALVIIGLTLQALLVETASCVISPVNIEGHVEKYWSGEMEEGGWVGGWLVGYVSKGVGV